MSENGPIFIIDGANLYIRSFVAYPTMSSHGYQMGGCIGFLKTLQRLCREFQPSQVYVAWEGGGSQRRRKIYPEYKLGRKPEKLNRFYGDDIPDSDDNKKHQMITLLSMLRHIPVCQIYVSDCEGDDIVAHLCNGPFRKKDKIIVSSDKDMYQLLDDSTKIYSLHRKCFVTSSTIFEEFRVKPHNFALVKSLCGDVSDNIPGIEGVGFKTAAKKFPFLASDSTILLQEVLDYAASHASESAIYKRIFLSSEEVKRNWKLVHLNGGMLSGDQVMKVENVINTFVPKFDKMSLIRQLVKEGINDFNVEGLFYDLSCVNGVKPTSEKQQ
jgi:5'-3' exonuclease